MTRVNTKATQMQHKQHKCKTNATQATRLLQECDTSATRVKHFDFGNDTSENIFSHPYTSYMANERLQGEEQFHSENYLSQKHRSHPEMRSKSAPLKLNFLMTKEIERLSEQKELLR